MAGIKSNSVKLDKKEANTPPPEPIKTERMIQKDSDTLGFSSTPAPAASTGPGSTDGPDTDKPKSIFDKIGDAFKGNTDQNGQNQSQTGPQIPDDIQFIRFDLITDGAPDELENQLRQRGVPQSEFDAINYGKFKEVQKKTTPLIIQKYIPFYYKWALEINFLASWLVPPVWLGARARARIQQDKQQGESGQHEVPQQQPNNSQNQAKQQSNDLSNFVTNSFTAPSK